MDRIIFHIDVNNAFLSWTAIELLSKGYKKDIRNIVSVIGGDEKTRNGIVLSKSTLAKKFGIKTGETLYSARKKYKNLEVFPANYDYYSKMSTNLFKLLSNYSPDIEVASIDECYLDYGKVKNLYGDEIEFAYKLKDEIKNKLGFTVNIGIANNKLCAKMASDFEKPDKVHTLYNNEIKTKMWPLPIEDLFGIGRSSSEKLKSIGIKTIEDLATSDKEVIYKIFKNQSEYAIDIANGIDNSELELYWEAKGISNEITLPKDERNIDVLNEKLLMLSEMVGKRLRKESKFANTICVILKDSSFIRKSHQMTLKNSTDSTNEIYRVSKEILKEFYKGEPIRLIGIRLDNLTNKESHQISLFENYEINSKDSKLDKIVDEINDKLGKDVIRKASLKDKYIRNKKY